MGLGTFSLDLEKFCTKAKINLETACRKIAFDVAKDIIQATPVDTGLAMGNWYPSVGALVAQTGNEMGEQASLSRMATSTQGWNIKQPFFITNSLPYIEALEYGHSKQASNGMIRATLARYQQIVSGAIQ